ncbi:MAG: hypothetical protein K6F94_03085 [Bacteroidaceae bacterium]|nr:hypothetical protein [Bacteroidaceae bacterium]
MKVFRACEKKLPTLLKALLKGLGEIVTESAVREALAETESRTASESPLSGIPDCGSKAKASNMLNAMNETNDIIKETICIFSC